MLPLPKGPNRAGVSLPSPEEGKWICFRKIVFFSNLGPWAKSRTPVILSVRNHCQIFWILFNLPENAKGQFLSCNTSLAWSAIGTSRTDFKKTYLACTRAAGMTSRQWRRGVPRLRGCGWMDPSRGYQMLWSLILIRFQSYEAIPLVIAFLTFSQRTLKTIVI
jgi:hypothetical protein